MLEKISSEYIVGFFVLAATGSMDIYEYNQDKSFKKQTTEKRIIYTPIDKNKDNKYDELLNAFFIFLKENNALPSANNQITKLEANGAATFIQG